MSRALLLLMLHGVTSDIVRDYWQTVDASFAHVNYSTYLRGEDALISRWKTAWMDRWAARNSLRGKRVGDYGIGAGLLGELLCKNYSVAHYVGIDIAARQLEATAARFDKLPDCNRTLILQTSKLDFSALGLDVFISQQV